jgi:hypothetical protein
MFENNLDGGIGGTCLNDSPTNRVLVSLVPRASSYSGFIMMRLVTSHYVASPGPTANSPTPLHNAAKARVICGLDNEDGVGLASGVGVDPDTLLDDECWYVFEDV